MGTLWWASVDGPPAKPSSMFVRGSRELLDSNKEFSWFIPDPLCKIFVDRPAPLNAALKLLVDSTEEYERIVSTAQELTDIVRPQLLNASAETEQMLSEPFLSVWMGMNRGTVPLQRLHRYWSTKKRESLSRCSFLGAILLRRVTCRTQQSPTISKSAGEHNNRGKRRFGGKG